MILSLFCQVCTAAAAGRRASRQFNPPGPPQVVIKPGRCGPFARSCSSAAVAATWFRFDSWIITTGRLPLNCSCSSLAWHAGEGGELGAAGDASEATAAAGADAGAAPTGSAVFPLSCAAVKTKRDKSITAVTLPREGNKARALAIVVSLAQLRDRATGPHCTHKVLRRLVRCTS